MQLSPAEEHFKLQKEDTGYSFIPQELKLTCVLTNPGNTINISEAMEMWYIWNAARQILQ